MNNIPRTLLEGHLKSALPYISGRLLNAGCGENTYEKLYGPFVTSQIRMDWPKTIHVHDAIDIYGDVTVLPFADATFDTILCTEVLEHVARPGQALREFFRVLKPGGNLVLSTPFLYQVHEAPYDFYRYTYYGMRRLTEDAGFKVNLAFARGGLMAVVLFFSRKLIHRVLSRVIGARLTGKLPLTLIDGVYLWLGGKRVRHIDAQRQAYTLGYTVIAAKPQ